MIVIVNDIKVNIDRQTLEEYIYSIKQQAKGIAVCLNLDIISMNDWANIILKEGDRLDIIEATAGG